MEFHLWAEQEEIQVHLKPAVESFSFYINNVIGEIRTTQLYA